ncbi:uncharacterized protein LOC121406028 [Lytechinus variegatus]|uniref:uncharacterized protein LOC121406028 n=1 Tax=Lytechinus variegatus TaxID=7654 RepID=UPI001BB1476B|nr:uncharacterized protein LOC121406028 [Lytechinus variegatus]
MDPPQGKRPQRQAATKQKTYVQSTRKGQSVSTRNSPPNSNSNMSNTRPTSPVRSAASASTPENSDGEPQEDDVIAMARGAISGTDQPSTLHIPHANAGLSTALDDYFTKTTARFEKMIKSAVDSFVGKLQQLEAKMEASFEFERKRVDDLTENQNRMKTKIESMEKEISELRLEVQRNKVAVNRSERFSRRNNVRLVGIPEVPQGEREDPVTMVEEILHSKFKVKTKVERAHRDGKKVDGRPRHILLKFLSYREKIDVMRRARETLKDETYFMTDDLTPTDLEEKKKWIKQVQELYSKGTKLRFYSGKWRQAGGIPFNFV